MKTKLVLNQCIGEFCLSSAALALLESLHSPYAASAVQGQSDVWYVDIPRNDPDLIKTCEALGQKASGKNAHLALVEIDASKQWTIISDDGMPGYEFVEVD